MARSIGISEITPDTLKLFDQAYMAFYPYLSAYATEEDLRNKRVLEIGLGYGTLGQFLSSQGCDYYGLDIAEGPVAMMIYRQQSLGHVATDHFRVGSALDIPFAEETFDYVYSIGCLHHTGNLPKSIAEVHRVLRPRGRAIIMLYNRYSFRQLVQIPLQRVLRRLSSSRRLNVAEWKRSMYDRNSAGDAPPFTEFVSRREIKKLFARFSSARIDCRNFDTCRFINRHALSLCLRHPHSLFSSKTRRALLQKARDENPTQYESRSKPLIAIPREMLLNSVGRIVGLDLYIVAQK